MARVSSEAPAVSRRNLLRAAAATTAAAGALAGGAAAAEPEARRRSGGGGRKFHGVVRLGEAIEVRELTLLPPGDFDVVVRTSASPLCYSIARGLLSRRSVEQPELVGHAAVGVVEDVGAMVKRVRPGDRVIVAGTPLCGQCYNCTRGRWDHCEFVVVGGLPKLPRAEFLAGGARMQVAGDAVIGGLSEVTVAREEYLSLVVTKLDPAELALLGDTIGCGFATITNYEPPQVGQNVVVFGAGPVGIGAIQAARLTGAGQIIVVEPVEARRALATKLGATTVLDPNVEGDGLVEKIRQMCSGPNDRVFAGGRTHGRPTAFGADFTVEAVGDSLVSPRSTTGPDPRGISVMRQAWEVTRAGGHYATMGLFSPGDVSFPADQYARRARTHHASQAGNMNILRDLPNYVRMAERGELDVRSVVTARPRMDETLAAAKAVADRSTVAAVTVID